jgi:hypothetical protein
MIISPEVRRVNDTKLLLNCTQNNTRGGQKSVRPLCYAGLQGKLPFFLTNGAETGQFPQLTRIKSWDNIEKIGIIPTDYKKLVEDKR